MSELTGGTGVRKGYAPSGERTTVGWLTSDIPGCPFPDPVIQLSLQAHYNAGNDIPETQRISPSCCSETVLTRMNSADGLGV